MHITHVQGLFSPEHGGPTVSLSNYVTQQVRRGHRVSVRVLTGLPNASPAVKLEPPVDYFAGAAEAPTRLGRSSELRRKLRSDPTPDIYHLHGAWLRAMYYGANEAQRRARPYLVEMMGMYEPYGLQISRAVKQVARPLFQDSLLRKASCLHVNSAEEAENVHALGFTRPIAVIPVGVDVESIVRRGAAGDGPLEATLGPVPIVLYLARLHPKKGVELLLNAWGNARNKAGWKLVLAGSGDRDYVEHCQTLARDLGIGSECVWLGHVNDEQKSFLLHRASLYVLPSYSENFGNSVAEALAHKTPVITTTVTPWKELPEQGCGWVVGPDAAQLTECLDAALASRTSVLKEMGQRGAQLVAKSYSLEIAAERIELVYRWLLNGGAAPEFVLPMRVKPMLRTPRKREKVGVVLSTNTISRNGGGLFESVRALAQYLHTAGDPVEVLSCSDGWSSTDSAAWAPVKPRSFQPLLPNVVRYARGISSVLKHSDADVLHTHGVWQFPSYVALSWKQRGRTHIMSPRGMLEPWALRYRGWKKVPIWWLVERRNCLSAHAVHATSIQEARQVRRLGYEGPIAVIPNGVPLPDIIHKPPAATKTALFLSRVHEKKGLEMFLQAWARVLPAGWKFVICGPGDPAYLAKLEQLVRIFGLKEVVSFVGGSYNGDRDALYRHADLFVLPSYSENFGLVVAEALSWQVPVLTTKGTPWRELESMRCGWWVDPDASSLADALSKATTCSDGERHEMGVRGRALVESNYTWDVAGSQMRTFYRWVLDGGETPPFIFDR
jgi:glycosyltransferase involved in cell wall biosynthesis